MINPTNMRVNVNTIKNNIESIQKELGDRTKIMPVIKGYAYGIGFDIISLAISESPLVGVATVAEAVMLKNFYGGEIFILYQPGLEDIPFINEHGFHVGVSDNIEFLKLLNKKSITPKKIHLNIECGSGMLGIKIANLKKICKKIKALKNIVVDGIYMHYSCTESDCNEDVKFSSTQTELFKFAIRIAEDILGEIPFKHAGCSSALIAQPNARYNMVRIGILLYGYYPALHLREFIDVKPALKLTTKIIQITEYPAGYYIGYSRMFTTFRKTKVATISGGYADGINRSLFENGDVVVNGQKAPIIGQICMNIAMIDITDIKGTIKHGDEVALWDNDIITLYDYAIHSNTDIVDCMVRAGKNLNCVVDNYI